MPSEQAINQFVAQPINNLVVFLAIIALAIVLVVVFLVWKFGPSLYKLYERQADTNAKLTKILDDSEKRAEQRTVALQSLGVKTDNQTAVLNSLGEKTDRQTETLDRVGKVFSDHHIATSETVANLVDKVDNLEKATIESIAALTEQIKALVNKLEDKAACADAEERMRKLRDEMLAIATREQAVRSTSESPANVIPFAGEQASEGLPKAS